VIPVLDRFLYKPPRLFLSYRRASSKDVSGRLAALLRQRLGHTPVFMDVTSIAPGQDYLDEVRSQIKGAIDAMLVIIGPGWADLADPGGDQRLADPDDPVRIEVEQALSAESRLIPVLVDGAEMPTEDELPESIRPLARRNALVLRHESFEDDSERLLKAVRGPLAWGRIVAVPLLLSTVWIGASLMNGKPMPPDPIMAAGRVVDASGAAVANAKVEIRRDSVLLASGSTDDSGRLAPLEVVIADPLSSVEVRVLLGDRECYSGDHVLRDPIEVLLADCPDSIAAP